MVLLDDDQLALIARRVEAGVTSLRKEAERLGQDYQQLRLRLIRRGHMTVRPRGVVAPGLTRNMIHVLIVTGEGGTLSQAGREIGVSKQRAHAIRGMWPLYLRWLLENGNGKQE